MSGSDLFNRVENKSNLQRISKIINKKMCGKNFCKAKYFVCLPGSSRNTILRPGLEFMKLLVAYYSKSP
jgi:hypothetical protein